MAVGDAAQAFAAYEAVRHRLPCAAFPKCTQRRTSLADIADLYDVFFLDGFGVLNRGDTAVPGAVERIAALRAAGKQVIVVTNAAGYPKRLVMERYRRLGFDFVEDEVVSGRDALTAHLAAQPPRRWGMMVSQRFRGDRELERFNAVFLTDDPLAYAEVAGFLLLGSAEWTEHRQALLESAVAGHTRPVLVGNPDIVAPCESGFSQEPGYYAHRLADATGIAPEFFGKPFPAIFKRALARVTPASPDRVVMVGDTLQTDILGGAAMGFDTVLVEDHGTLAGENVVAACASSGIRPTYIIPSI